MRQGTPTPAGAMPEQRGRVTGGRPVRRAGETGGRATVPDVRAVRGARGAGGGDHDDRAHGRTVWPAPNVRRGRPLRLVAGRVARVLAHVRQEGPADETGVLPSQGHRQKGEAQALRQEVPADQEAQVQPAPVRRLRVLRGRPEKTAGDGHRRRARQGLCAERARTQRVRLLSRHAVRQTRRIPDPVQGQRKLFRNLRTEVNLESWFPPRYID